MKEALICVILLVLMFTMFGMIRIKLDRIEDKIDCIVIGYQPQSYFNPEGKKLALKIIGEY